MTRFVSLNSGSSGNVSLISHKGTHILIDAGAGVKDIRSKLLKFDLDLCDIAAVLLTHEHTDHIKGIRPLAVTRKIPVYANVPTALSVCGYCLECEERIVAFDDLKTFVIGDVEITAFPTMHDAASPVGYRFSFPAEGKTIGYATDTGAFSDEIIKNLKGCDFVFLESNHDIHMLKNGPYPYYLKRRIMSERGHLSNDDCAAFLPCLVESGTKNVMLAHLSRHNNAPDIAERCAADTLSANAIKTGRDIILDIAPAFDMSRAVSL